ncbi:MAG: C69 family dipeptidase [Anaerolineaceae bacterium]|nr:C69 family dipeptidase [Anaerolineaceae bacterium]
MCDTLVALSSVTVDGNVYFAKNSDREPNEAQSVVCIPAKDYASGSVLRCTYRSIPQVEHTHAIVLSKPFWIWGAEMGANDQGVVIGNEAVFTKVPQEKEPGLIGMDLLRLGLERSDCAYNALLIITKLLEEYGQSGECGYQHKMVYHNSFLICDREEAWVLETAGRQWAAERVKDVRSISNALTIGNHWDLSSDDLVSYAKDKKWCSSRSDFNFAECYSDFLYTTFSDARARQSCTMNLLHNEDRKIELSEMMGYLRTHSRQMQGDWQPGKGVAGASVCMHAGWGPIRISQTTGSMIAALSTASPDTLWFTHTAAPCTSIFTPFWLDNIESSDLDEPKGEYQDGFDFWEHEILHRSILLNFEERIPMIEEERDLAEKRYMVDVIEMNKKDIHQRKALSEAIHKEVRDLRKQWISRVQETRANPSKLSIYHNVWRARNRACHIDQYIK